MGLFGKDLSSEKLPEEFFARVLGLVENLFESRNFEF
jgi:hypothetical protein